MHYTLVTAAKLAGIDELIIRDAIECGRIIASKDLFDEWQIADTEVEKLRFSAGQQTADGSGLPTHECGPTVIGPMAFGPMSLGPEKRALIRQADNRLRRYFDGDPVPSHSDINQQQASQQLTRGVGQRSDLHMPPHSSRADQGEASTVERIPCWHHDVRIEDDENNSTPTAPAAAYRRLISPARKALLLVFAIGWIGGSISYPVIAHGVSFISDKKKDSLSEVSEKRLVDAATRKRTISAPSALSSEKNIAVARSGRRSDTTQSIQLSTPVTNNSMRTAQQNPAESVSTAIASRRKMLARSTSFPETRPTTIEGWTVQSIVDGAAVLQGPDGVRKVSRGDIVPGLGRIDTIVRWGNRWIVATTNGLITTP